MEVIWGGWTRSWLLLNTALMLLLWGCWSLSIDTHLAAQEYPRTILAFEVVPVLALGGSIMAMSQRMPWILRGASRPHAVALLMLGTIQIIPALCMPVVVVALLRAGLGDLGDREVTASVVELFPWSFPLSLIPTLLLCAAAGLLVEGIMGRGAGGLAPVLVEVGIIVWQSHGGATWLAGAPGGDDHLPWWSPLVVSAILALALAVWLRQRAGARGLLASQ
ncbi:hypothetical protein M3G03_04105 [Aestuariimicrobium sp. p3-SID1156]|uniref:hypothetical protein n=1 Tax=Aestuariimicrobium sp. p3-SID1156 TaxID=2916038 RepID=UPI00223C3865|nr:hypothetical protein [Aestuariimicrobium sp. p3-SID1156]MCT1458732.1 hypothetical protein [Aestuariimicrobium sp. p3-SID1156]